MVLKRLFSFSLGLGIGAGLGASVMHRVDKAAQAAAQAASPSFLAKKAGAGMANMVTRFGEGWQQARPANEDADAQQAPATTTAPAATDAPPADDVPSRPLSVVRRLRAG